MTEASVQVQAPVFTVDGQLTRTLGRDCLRLEISEGLGGLRTLEAEFLAVGAGDDGPPGPLRHLDGSTVDFGRSLKVAIGPDSGQRFAFDGTVSALELVISDGEPQRAVVLAEDALMRLRMTRRLRSWTRVTDAELASSIAGEHGLDADVQADGPRYDVVQQLNQSDLAFLRERARLLQAELWCTGSTLHFRSRDTRSATEVALTVGAQLLSARLAADLSAQRGEVVVSGYDAGQRAAVTERAGSDVVEAETSGGRSGASLVTRALGASASVRVREVPLSSEEAQAWARAEMLRRGRAFVTVSGVTNGTPDLVVGSRLTLRLVGEPFEGEGYYVTSIRHRFDLRTGLRTEFTAQRATLNEVS
ncbi:phage late control D family protein [Nocardioides sp. zg-1230]|uniref:phage late control D family protein n=1 Tax=Nocardioides sp. zg-1230 TaxID=2736601 RepID=UPI001551B15D|nr:contractile injection system protein, VgrG/Pvc8 family [Nocardioides sp. zg-1230]NPC44586.1 phage late control D family protein [Nocardioides sp. zg-1230]